MTKLRGYDIEKIGSIFFFKDTGQPTATTWQNRPCGHCKKHNTIDGHDACFGKLKHVMNACCGHGIESDAYLQYWDGSTIRGQEALVKARELQNSI